MQEERVIEAPGPTELQIAIQATGLCGSVLEFGERLDLVL